MKSKKEIKEYFLNNQEQLKKLKEIKIEEYSLNKEMSDLEFLNWNFAEYDFYIFDGYIETPLYLKGEKYLTIEDKKYIKYKIYKDTESNLKLFSIVIGNSLANMMFLNEEEMKSFNENIKILDRETFDKFYLINRTDKFNKKVFHATDDDWYGTYRLNLNKKNDPYEIKLRKRLSTTKDFDENEGYCELRLIKQFSNLDLWTIVISGNDDYSVSKDFLSEKEVNEEWNRLLLLKYINHEELENYYFSN